MKFKNPKTGNVFSHSGTEFCGGYTCDICPIRPFIIAEEADGSDFDCADFVATFPYVSARRMGYEVIKEDTMKTCGNCFDSEYIDGSIASGRGPRVICKETGKERTIFDTCEVNEKMEDEKKQPRICEILEVDVGETFVIRYGKGTVNETDSFKLKIEDNGGVYSYQDGVKKEIGSIALLHAINHPESIVKCKKLTQDELTLCKLIGAKYVTMNEYPYEVKRVDFWSDMPELYMEGGIYKAYRGTEKSENISFVYPGKMQSVKPGDLICLEDYL